MEYQLKNLWKFHGKAVKNRDTMTPPRFIEKLQMDELTRRNNCLSGHYRLVPIDRSGVAKMDELIVKIDVITGNCAMGP